MMKINPANFFLSIALLNSINLVAQNVGIGTTTPQNRLHVFSGSAGIAAFPLAPLIVESATHNYINILAPNSVETGILFGKPEGNTSGGIIYNSASTLNGFQFRTDGNHTKMILDRNGRLGLNAFPDFHVFKILQTFGSGGLDIQNSATNDDWELSASGQGSSSSFQLLFNNHFRGSFNNATGAYSSISDERLKNDIQPMGMMLKKIKQLKPYSYRFKNTVDTSEYNGFIAQDIMQLFPSMVTHTVVPERKIDVYTLDYSQFGVLAIKGIQELQSIIEIQNQSIINLEDRVARFEQIIQAMAKGK